MKSHIQQLEESKSQILIININQNNLSNSIQKQIQELTQKVQRIIDIENLKNNKVMIIQNWKKFLINEQFNCFSYLLNIQSKNNSLQNISKINPNETSWKQRFIKLNKEYFELQPICFSIS
ncbi:unnamed protein product [Paramecium primaurelia]|uniref:Uncharacterized protein n=1 Tax=Paramecium primaurelia TaxID=5886 RepID=A0A8S1P5H4_PARPR|nr:unnamed protein product [Paramecium primaurelia]